VEASETFKWHPKAANQGFAVVQYNLGLMYTVLLLFGSNSGEVLR
jgi:hypothetical protein